MIVICIGGSLGGTVALRGILRELPAGFPQPIAIALHRHRDSEDTLLELLQKGCALTGREPMDKEPMLPGYFYLAPADYHLLVEDDHFSLSTDEAVSFARPSLDVLFESAADSYGPDAIAIVLTGANADGARGAQAIRQRGGLVIVEDPATAECPIMPNAALERAGADHVLPVPAIGRLLLQLAKRGGRAA